MRPCPRFAAPALLTVQDHDRAAVGMTYVYPVVSRRAGGVSVGVNLNPNNACNWACIYCQVPNLQRGGPPPVDLAQLEQELRSLLNDILQGDFLQREVPAASRRLNDIALSGNGEPTSAREFPEVIELIGRIMAELDPRGKIKLLLITNGSLAERAGVRAGISRMATLGGEVWFKLDAATTAGMRAINQTRTTPEKHLARLQSVATLAPTWVQTCVFAYDGEAPAAAEQQAYLDALGQLVKAATPLKGVLLYGLARPSLQSQAARLSALPAAWLEAYAERIRALGFTVKVTP